MIIDEAVAIGRVICETDPARAAARDAALRSELADPAANTVEPPHPRLGKPSTTVGSGGVEGRLSVQGRVEVDGRVGLYDDVVGGAWQLIGWEHDPTTGLDEADLSWFAGIGGTARAVGAGGPVRDVDGSYHRWFQEHQCTVVLVRPDFYVFGAGTSADVPLIVAGLKHLLCPTSPEQKVTSSA